MARRKLGLWLIGARGGVATTVSVGLAALRLGLADHHGLVTALPKFSGLDFAKWTDFVVGGHEIRETTLLASAQELVRNNHALDGNLVAAVSGELAKIDQQIRPGTLHGVGERIASLAGAAMTKLREAPRATIERVQADWQQFTRKHGLDQLLVVNLASTEPPLDTELPPRWKDLAKLLDKKKFSAGRLKREKEAAEKEIQEAFAKVEKMHVDPEDEKSELYGDRIAAGKVPGDQKVAGAEPGADDDPTEKE